MNDLIAVVDTQWTGHIPMFHRLLVERVLALGYRCASISPKPGMIFEWSKSLSSEQQKNLRIEPFRKPSVQVGGPISSAALEHGLEHDRARLWWHQVANNLASIKPNLVLLPGIDTNIISRKLKPEEVDAIFPFPWMGLYLTPKYFRKGAFKFAYKRLLRKDKFFSAAGCVAISVLDEKIIPRMKRVFPNKPILTMPDMTDLSLPPPHNVSALAEKIKHFAKDRKIIGLYGELSERKGVLTLLNVAEMALKKKKPWVFVLAGPFNDKCNTPESFTKIKGELAKGYPNVFLHLERIPEEARFNEIFCLSDLVYAVYENFYHSSNILTKAAHFQKPVVVAKGYCMGERVSEFGLGFTVPENDPRELYKSIDKFFGESRHWPPDQNIPQIETYKRRHSLIALDEFLKEVVSKPRAQLSKT